MRLKNNLEYLPKYFTIFFCFFIYGLLSANPPKDIFPFKLDTLNYNLEDEQKFNKMISKCDSLLSTIETEEAYSELDDYERKAFDLCDRETWNYYDVSLNCSWYCGGTVAQTNSSPLAKTNKKELFELENIHDGNHYSSWKSKNTQQTEWIDFRFEYYNPRITSVAITNGDVKTEKSYFKNTRAKTISVFYNDSIIKKLHLLDIRSTQYFKLDTLGFKKSIDSIQKADFWNLRFEIVNHYYGKKKKNTSITEISFDGIDVHCLAKGTKILMADSSYKNIENIKEGDAIISYNERLAQYEKDIVLETAKAYHHKLYKIDFKDQSSITITDDHPIYQNNSWTSLNPSKTMSNYGLTNVVLLNTQNSIQGKKIGSITEIIEPQMTFTITKLAKNKSFIANSILVGTE